VVSTFGVMFAPDQMKAASELMRGCKPGGRIGLANLTPGSFIGELFKVIGRHVPPPAGIMSPALRGDESWLNERFGAGASAISAAERRFIVSYRDAAHFVAMFETLDGPRTSPFRPSAPTARRRDFLDIVARFDTREAFMRVSPTCAEVIIDKA